MNLKNLRDNFLIKETQRMIKIESSATIGVIRRFREIFQRELYLEYGFSSLFEMATEFFGYDNAPAQRRINAMKLMISVPELEAKMASKEISLQVAADLQTFLNFEKKRGQPYSIEQKTALVEESARKSVSAVRKELARRNPIFGFKEINRYLSDDRIEIRYSISAALDVKHNRLKQIWSHSNPSMTHEELIEKITDMALEAVDPIARAKRAENRAAKLRKSSQEAATYKEGNSAVSKSAEAKPKATKSEAAKIESESVELAQAIPNRKMSKCELRLTPFKEEEINDLGEIQLAVDFDSIAGCTDEQSKMPDSSLPSAEVRINSESAGGKRSRYIPSETVREVTKENQEVGCEFKSAETGRRCGSKHFAQFDHIKPWSHSGSNDADNLRVYCAAHNRWRWRNRANSVIRTARAAYV